MIMLETCKWPMSQRHHMVHNKHILWNLKICL
jgi:hypothetical protein